MAIAVCCALAILLMKDVLLLGATSNRIILKLSFYSALTMSYLLIAMAPNRNAMLSGVALSLHSPLIWSLQLMAPLWGGSCTGTPQADFRRVPWLIALVPSPMLLLCLLAAASQFGIGVLAPCLWIGAVIFGVAAYGRVCAGYQDSDFAARFAELANWGCSRFSR